MLKAILKPWLDESYAVTGNIEGKLATMQETQQKLHTNSIGGVTEHTMEDAKQAAAQCTTKVAIIQSSWKDFTQRSPHLPSDSRASHDVCVGGILGTGSPKDSVGAKIPCFGSTM